MEFLQTIKNRATIWSGNSTAGYLYTEKETLIQKDTCATMFTAPLFTIAKVCDEPKCHWWMDKVCVCVCVCV